MFRQSFLFLRAFMPNLLLLTTFLRELFVERTLPREPEPDLIMDDPVQVSAYVDAGRINGVMAAAYIFHSARISQVIQGCSNVLDLGCGPATQLAQVAELNPDISFTGIDLSATMLTDAEKHIKNLGLTNVTFHQGNLVDLKEVQDKSIDAVISTMALHHLPTLQNLEDCFASINRVLKPDGSIYITDFGRLKSLKSVITLAYMNAKHQPHIFSLDYERSLRAAFLKEEFEMLAAQYLPKHVSILSTFKMPILVVIKTKDNPLPKKLNDQLKNLRKALPSRYRRDLDDIRTFFKFGGLANDPFR